MKIFVDADACPKVIRDFICKSAFRMKINAVFVSNSYIALPKSSFVSLQIVAAGFDEADNYIAKYCTNKDLAITNDIPLADELIAKSAKVISFTGSYYTTENIKQRLNMRDFMETMRGSGVLEPHQMGGQKPFSDKDKKQFADQFNTLIAKMRKAKLS